MIQRGWLGDDNNKHNWAQQQKEEIANKHEGSFYVAFVPHPSKWGQQNFEQRVKLCKYRKFEILAHGRIVAPMN